MALIGIDDVSHYYGNTCVFNGVSFSVENHHRIGLVGHNGCGKTTLLEIISGRLIPSKGLVHKRKGLNISYLLQSIDVDSRYDLLTYMLRSHKRVMELIVLIKELEEMLQDNPSSQNVSLLDDYQAEFAALDGYSIEPKAKMILQKLSFTEKEWSRPVNSFSGGEKTRIQLAASLIAPADMYLFDEPTNHLDIKMRDWLERYLNDINTPYIIVSHDRHFLEKTTTTTLAFENIGLSAYSGSYSFYEKESQLKWNQHLKAFESQQNYIEKTEDFIRKNIAGQKTKQAKSRRKALSRLEKLERPNMKREVNLSIKSTGRSGNIVFSFDELSFGFPDRVLAENITQTVYYRDRIAVLGENGCGKTTFLQTIMGERRPLQGKVIQGANLTVGYYDQMHVLLNDNLSVYQTISNVHPDWDRYKVLSYVAGFGFYEDDVEKQVSMLSGGEKARLYLAQLISQKPNLLIMDEPTNHLDIFMIKSLEKALEDYDGTIIFVSHDRYLINNIAERFFLFHKGGMKETHRWEELILGDSRDNDVSKKSVPAHQKEAAKKIKRINPLLLEKKLQRIESIEKEINLKMEEQIEWQSLYAKKETFIDGERVKEINRNIDRLKQEIKALQSELDILEEEYLQAIDSAES